MAKEVWKDVPCFLGKYQASSLGRIRSLDRHVTMKNRWGGKTTQLRRGVVLRFYKNKTTGYFQVSYNGGTIRADVHRVVAAAFFGGEEIKNKVINHIDFNRENNNIKNLEAVSVQENSVHSLRHGRHNKAKLSKKDVLEIRSSGASTAALAATYGVSLSTIQRVISRRLWAFY